MKQLRHPFALTLALAASTAVHAGRPLAVDDAGTNVRGEGHVEVWAARADGATTVNVSPAYAPLDGLELSAVLARDTTNRLTGSAVQLKWLATPSRAEGCNAGLAVGATRASGGGVSADGRFVNGIGSCNGTPLGNVHLNLGLTKVSSLPSATTWGLALERELGAVTPHIEWFGTEGSKPALQVGARADIAKGVQLDGTVGRGDGATLATIGLKFKF